MQRTPSFHRLTSDAAVQQPNAPSSESPVEDSKSEQSSANHHVKRGVLILGWELSWEDVLVFAGIYIMLIWPWLFFVAVWTQRGIQMNNHVAKVVENHPHATTYIITLICNITSMIVAALLALAIIRYAQEFTSQSVSKNGKTEPFTLMALHALRRQAWPWRYLGDTKHLLAKERRWLVVLVFGCVCTFPQVTSSTASLLTPAPFSRTTTLTGTELDFSATASECLDFFAANLINNTCGYQSYKGLYYTNCLGENQMVDVLEAGRGNILELVSNNSQSLTFSQLGADDGLHFLGSIRGILPIGPNGVPAFNTLEPSPFSNPEIVAGMMSYDYTLNHQGLISNVSCSYTQTYPFHFQSLDNDGLVLAYNSSCAALGGIEVLTNVQVIPSTNSRNFLAYWACQSAPGGAPMASYTIYLAGINHYAAEVGNITCTVNPIQAAIFPVTYQSTSRIFTAANTTTTASPIAFPMLINYALIGLGEVISEGQNSQSNPVAESVFTFGAKSFNKLPAQSDLYLQLFERMIQGIIEYEITYIRLLYSTVLEPPSACVRTVKGTANYKVFGWFVTVANIWFLFPITIINLGALFAVSQAMSMAKIGDYKFLPSDERPVEDNGEQEKATEDKKEVPGEWKDKDKVPDEWRIKIAFNPTSIWKEYFKSQGNPGKLIRDGINDVDDNRYF